MEAEIRRLEVKLEAPKIGECAISGSQTVQYEFRNGEFSKMGAELGDETVGVDFYTKEITEFTSKNYNASALAAFTKKRFTGRCISLLAWEVDPKIKVSENTKPQLLEFQIGWSGELGIVENNSVTYNEMVYSTGFRNGLAVRETRVQFVLPKAYPESSIRMLGNSGTPSPLAKYDEAKGIVTFDRSSYIAPFNRYTVRVWFPASEETRGCSPCGRLREWQMLLFLTPFFLCFAVPCVYTFLSQDGGKSASGSLGRTGSAFRISGESESRSNHFHGGDVEREPFLGVGRTVGS